MACGTSLIPFSLTSLEIVASDRGLPRGLGNTKLVCFFKYIIPFVRRGEGEVEAFVAASSLLRDWDRPHGAAHIQLSPCAFPMRSVAHQDHREPQENHGKA